MPFIQHYSRKLKKLVAREVRNTGPVAGAEVVQLYVGYPGAQVLHPVKELKDFPRAELQPGESRGVELELATRCLAYYDVDQTGLDAETANLSHKRLGGIMGRSWKKASRG